MSGEHDQSDNGVGEGEVRDEGRRSCLWDLATVVGIIIVGPPIVQVISRIRVGYDPGLENQKHLIPTNEAAILRAATVQFMVSGSRMGHGSLVKSSFNDSYLIYTAGHVVEALRRYDHPTVRIPGVGWYPIDPDLFFSWEKRGRETDSGSFYPIRQENQDRAVRFAVGEKILQPLVLAQRRPSIDDLIAIPREELAVYTLYRIYEFLEDSNRYLLNSPNPESTRLCMGDSGSPALRVPINGEVYGVLVGAGNITPETPMSEKTCFDKAFVRPNG